MKIVYYQEVAKHLGNLRTLIILINAIIHYYSFYSLLRALHLNGLRMEEVP